MDSPAWRYTRVGDVHPEVLSRAEVEPGELPLVSFFVSEASMYEPREPGHVRYDGVPHLKLAPNLKLRRRNLTDSGGRTQTSIGTPRPRTVVTSSTALIPWRQEASSGQMTNAFEAVRGRYPDYTS